MRGPVMRKIPRRLPPRVKLVDVLGPKALTAAAKKLANTATRKAASVMQKVKAAKQRYDKAFEAGERRRPTAMNTKKKMGAGLGWRP